MPGFFMTPHNHPIAHLQSKKPCAPFQLITTFLMHAQAAAAIWGAPLYRHCTPQSGSPHCLLCYVNPFPFSLSPLLTLFTALVKNQFASSPASNHEVPFSVMGHLWLRRRDSHTEQCCAAGAWPQVSSCVPIPPPTPSLHLSWAITSFQPCQPSLPTRLPSSMFEEAACIPSDYFREGSQHKRVQWQSFPPTEWRHQPVIAPKHTLNYSSSWPFFFILSSLKKS